MAKIKKIDDELKLATEGVKTATDNLNNMNYDNFKQGSMYQGLQKNYAQQGQQAMKDTLGQVAARTGGMASSYATSAANQSYNNYMRQLEDVARAMYNDEYSKARDKVSLAQSEYDRLYGEKRDAVADQRYEDEWAYQKGRDEITDQRYLTDKEEERVKDAAYYGNAPDYATYKANGGTLSERDYNSLVAIGEGMSADAHYEQNLTDKATRDSELKGIFGAEGFLWGDWDGDGKVGTEDTDGEVDAEGNPITFEDLYGGSSYGEDYWKAYAEGAASDRKNTRIAKEKESGALFNSLLDSTSASLSADDQAAFDEAYGDGAYDTVQTVISNAKSTFGETSLPKRGDKAEQGNFLTSFDNLYYATAAMLPQFSQEQIFELFDKIIPGVMRIFEDPTAYFGEKITPYTYNANGAGIYITG